MKPIYFLILATLLFACSGKNTESTTKTPTVIRYTVKSAMPHDAKAFTQGLVVHQGKLFESTGQADSWVGIVNVETGVADKKVTLPVEFFGEGITIMNNKVYQLTWKHKKGFVYDLASFKKLKEFSYKTEGWGITNDSTMLIMSDGSDKLYFMDTASFAVKKTLAVTFDSQPVDQLNELEYVDGYVFANIWQTNNIVKIDAKTGVVVGMLDLTELAQRAGAVNQGVDVLNGVAWHPSTNSMLITGKYWPFIFVLKLK